MSSATATAAITKKVAKATKTTKTEKSVDVSSDTPAPAQVELATADFGSDDEGPTVTVQVTEELTNDKPKKRGRKTNAEKASAESESTPSQEGVSISSVADALSRFSTLESELHLLVDFLRKNKTPFSKSEVTDLTRHHKKTNELHSKLSDSVVSTLSSTATVAVASATAAAVAEKSKKGFKKDGQLRKKAEHKCVNIHQVLQTYMDENDIIEALKTKDPEFATAFEERDDKRLTRPEVQQVFSHIISEMKKAYPEETKSTMMRTKKEKDGSETEVTDNTYYTVHGPKVTKFLTDTSAIIKAEMANGDSSKYKDNLATLTSGSMIDTDGNIPTLISQKWHMSYINFFITRD